MKTGKHLREFTRISAKVEVDVMRVSPGKNLVGHTECVSMKGLYIICDKPFPVDTECVITLWIGGRKSEITICAKGKVTFVDKMGMAAEFVSHLNMDSYNHLHSLVLYNAADEAETVEEEIENHLDKIRAE